MSEHQTTLNQVCNVTEQYVDLWVKLTPNASSNAFIGVVPTATDQLRLAIKIRAVPEKGRANKALSEFLAKELLVPKAQVEISKGTTSRLKTVRITGDLPDILNRLESLLSL